MGGRGVLHILVDDNGVDAVKLQYLEGGSCLDVSRGRRQEGGFGIIQRYG